VAALRIARSRISAFPIGWGFWRGAARFFARNPTSIPEMNDFVGFLQAECEGYDQFDFRGRTLEALRRRMHDWHRQLRAREIVRGESWKGEALPDVAYEVLGGDAPAVWRFRQIKTAVDLYREGQTMHHCVASYLSRCMEGSVSVWSLTCEFPPGKLNHGVTVELADWGEIVQCRGFANRRPHPNEVAMVRRWADEYGLTWRTPDQ
jgi:hypothetical protein